MWRQKAGCLLFCSAVHGKQPAKQPPVFNQDGRFSLHQPLLSVATATNNCFAFGVSAAFRLTAFPFCCPRQVLPQNSRQFSTKTAVFLSLVERKSRQKKERIWIRQKQKRRPTPTARKAAFHFAYRNSQPHPTVPKSRHCGDGYREISRIK